MLLQWPTVENIDKTVDIIIVDYQNGPSYHFVVISLTLLLSRTDNQRTVDVL